MMTRQTRAILRKLVRAELGDMKQTGRTQMSDEHVKFLKISSLFSSNSATSRAISFKDCARMHDASSLAGTTVRPLFFTRVPNARAQYIPGSASGARSDKACACPPSKSKPRGRGKLDDANTKSPVCTMNISRKKDMPSTAVLRCGVMGRNAEGATRSQQEASSCKRWRWRGQRVGIPDWPCA